MWFRPKSKVTNTPPAQLAFFYTQYIEVMKYGVDEFDFHLKQYLFNILISLGVPDRDLYVEAPKEEPEVIVEAPRPEKRTLLVHGKDEIRKLTYGVN